MLVLMVLGQENMDHRPDREGGEVPDGLHPRDESPSLLECIRLGPHAELRPLIGPGLPLQRPPGGTIQVPQEVQASPHPTTGHPDEGGWNLRGRTEVCPKTSGLGCEGKRVDLRGHVETRRRESLRAPRSCEVPVPYLEVGPRYRGELEGR